MSVFFDIYMILQTGYQWGTIGGGVGTTLVTANPANLIGVIIGGTYVGTVLFHDAAAIAGTTTTSGIITIQNPATTLGGFISIYARCKKGIVYEATGTPVMTYVWDGL